jgi:riboflavin synthase
VFTGIIETTGKVEAIAVEGSNKHFTLSSPITHELKIDQSVSHNGVCLTVVSINGNLYTVTAIDETLSKTNLNSWQPGDLINLERCMPANGRYDGHIVQGHVDTTAICKNIMDENGSWVFTFELPPNALMELIVDKGSICINGISLTVVSAIANEVKVAIIPYTYSFTNMHALSIGSIVNIEYDIVGKYLQKMLGKNKTSL